MEMTASELQAHWLAMPRQWRQEQHEKTQTLFETIAKHGLSEPYGSESLSLLVEISVAAIEHYRRLTSSEGGAGLEDADGSKERASEALRSLEAGAYLVLTPFGDRVYRGKDFDRALHLASQPQRNETPVYRKGKAIFSVEMRDPRSGDWSDVSIEEAADAAG